MGTMVLARFLATPENRSAIAALRSVLHALVAGDCENIPNPLFLHGPSGSGKTLLLRCLADELTDCDLHICMLSGLDFAGAFDLAEARDADLFVVEDLQHLPTRCVPLLISLIDECLSRSALMIFTALQGPGRLTRRGAPVPRRLTNRLAGGLVVRLEPMQATTRRRLLQELSQGAKLTLAPEILDWLAKHLIGSGRQLEGAIRQLKALQRLQAKPLRLDDIRAHFRTQIDATGPSVKRIAEHVSGYFQVPPKQVVSARRSHDVLLPRQVSMYLARQLTRLSLEQIGKYFGGRDHKTVQHACKKVETAMKSDAALSGAVRQMCSELQ